jgi:hypothetical protein
MLDATAPNSPWHRCAGPVWLADESRGPRQRCAVVMTTEEGELARLTQRIEAARARAPQVHLPSSLDAPPPNAARDIWCMGWLLVLTAVLGALDVWHGGSPGWLLPPLALLLLGGTRLARSLRNGAKPWRFHR